MKKKLLAAFFLICFLTTSVFAASSSSSSSSSSTTPEPYSKDEFPDWAKYLRRFEIVTLGSLPFTTMTASTIYTSIRFAQNGFQSEYIPNPLAFTSSEANLDQSEQKIVIYSAIATSLVIGIIDISIHISKIEKAKKANKKTLPDYIKVQTPEEFSNSEKENSENDNSKKEELKTDIQIEDESEIIIFDEKAQ